MNCSRLSVCIRNTSFLPDFSITFCSSKSNVDSVPLAGIPVTSDGLLHAARNMGDIIMVIRYFTSSSFPRKSVTSYHYTVFLYCESASSIIDHNIEFIPLLMHEHFILDPPLMVGTDQCL